MVNLRALVRCSEPTHLYFCFYEADVLPSFKHFPVLNPKQATARLFHYSEQKEDSVLALQS